MNAVIVNDAAAALIQSHKPLCYRLFRKVLAKNMLGLIAAQGFFFRKLEQRILVESYRPMLKIWYNNNNYVKELLICTEMIV